MINHKFIYNQYNLYSYLSIYSVNSGTVKSTTGTRSAPITHAGGAAIVVEYEDGRRYEGFNFAYGAFESISTRGVS